MPSASGLDAVETLWVFSRYVRSVATTILSEASHGPTYRSTPGGDGTGGPTGQPFVRQAVKIAGLGVYLPPRRVASTDLEKELSLSPGWVEQMVGVRKRRRRAAGQTAVEMAASPARRPGLSRRRRGRRGPGHQRFHVPTAVHSLHRGVRPA